MRQKRDDLAGETTKAVETSADSGKSYRTIFIPDAIPKGVGFWKCSLGEHFVDFIPWFSGKGHPTEPVEKQIFHLDLYVHQGVGAERGNWVCTQSTMKLPDTICNYISKNRPAKEEWNQIKPKRRCVYLVWVHDTPEEEEKGIQIWECAHHSVQRQIDAIALMPKTGAPIIYSDVDVGKTIRFKVTSAGKFRTPDGRDAESREYLGFSLFDRSEPIPDELLEMVFCLDDAVLWKPADKELQLAFYGGEAPTTGDDHEEREPAGDSPPPAPARRFGAAKPAAEEVREPAAPATPPRRFGGAAPAAAASPATPPARRFGNPAPAAAVDAPAPDEKSPEEEAGFVCPYNGTVGVDHDKLPECKTCDTWDPCADFADQIGGSRQSAAPAAPPAAPDKPRLRAPGLKPGATTPPAGRPSLTRRTNA
jgi:hypothetical protein